MYGSEDDSEYTISQITDELYKLNKRMTDLVEFVIGRHSINLKDELELYKTEIDEIKNKCDHSNIILLDCPLIKGNYVHTSHRPNCKTCYNIECTSCDSKFQCKSCYNDKKTDKEFFDKLDESSDSYDKYFTSSDEYKNRKYQKKHCTNCNRNYEYLVDYYC